MIERVRDVAHTVVSAFFVGALFAIGFTVIYLRGAWIDAMEQRRTLRDE